MYSREIEGELLTLAPSGWTYDRTFVLYDKESGSLWFPDEEGLVSIQGKYFLRRLPKVFFEDTEWGDWLKEYPESKILK